MDYWAENYYEEENNLFFEKLCCLFFTFFGKVRAICEFRF